METLLDGRDEWKESVYYLLFGEQKGYVRICALGKGSCLTSAAIKSCPGPTWMAAHLGLSPGSWEVKSHPGSNSEQGLPGECPAADCTTQHGCSRKEVPPHSFGRCSCLYGDFTWKKPCCIRRNEFPLLGSPWIVPIHNFPISCDSVFRTGSYFTLSPWNFLPVLEREIYKENLNAFCGFTFCHTLQWAGSNLWSGIVRRQEIYLDLRTKYITL